MEVPNMDVHAIVKEIKKHTWWSEESPGVHQIGEWAWRGFSESSQYFDPRFLSIGFFIYKNDFLYEETPRDEKLQQFYFLLDKFSKNVNYVAQKKKAWLRIMEPMMSGGWQLIKNPKSLPRKELADRYRTYTLSNTDQARYSAFIECVDPFTEEDLAKLIKMRLPKVSKEVRKDIALTMSTPAFLSFLEKAHLDFLASVKKVAKRKADIDAEAKKMADKYFWIATHYGEAKEKTAGQFKREIEELIEEKSIVEIDKEIQQLQSKAEELKKQKRQLIRRYTLPGDLLVIFKLINELGKWIDERKKFALQTTFISYRILDYLEKLLAVPARLLGYTTYDELYQWTKNNKNAISVNVLRKRRKFSVYVVRLVKPGHSTTEFIVGHDAKAIYNTFFPKRKMHEVQGMVVSGVNKKIRGKVCVVLNTSTDKFRGEILVTTMTRPDFLPFMRRAKAIVADEGGLTCHAAIISRELKIPCVIGTKFATRVFKDGDQVEVDAKRGIVRRI